MLDVLDSYGIVPDGRDISSGLMEALSAKKEVVLTEGIYMTGPITIPSDSRLVLEKGSVLRFIPDFSLYTPVFTRWEGVKCWAMHPCVFINEAENVVITGEGTIDGSGNAWWDVVADHKARKVRNPETEIEKREMRQVVAEAVILSS